MHSGDLDDLFAAARAAAPHPSAALLARVEADGLRLLPGSVAQLRRPQPQRRGLLGLFADMMRAIGGVGGAAGLATATLAGLWIGVVQPPGLSALTEGLTAPLGAELAFDSVELIPSFDPFATEG